MTAPTDSTQVPPASDVNTANPPARRKRTRVAIIAGLTLTALAVWYFAIRTPEPRNDHERFQGEWKLSIAGREKQMPVRVRVNGDTFAFLVGEQEQKRYAMTLRPESNPKEIDLTQLLPDGSPVLERHTADAPFTPVTLRGIYRFADGKLTVVTAPNPQPRPTAFDTPNEDEGLPAWLLERP